MRISLEAKIADDARRFLHVVVADDILLAPKEPRFNCVHLEASSGASNVRCRKLDFENQ